MTLVKRVPHDPEAIDISEIQRRKTLEKWNRRCNEPAAEASRSWWKALLGG